MLTGGVGLCLVRIESDKSWHVSPRWFSYSWMLLPLGPGVSICFTGCLETVVCLMKTLQIQGFTFLAQVVQLKRLAW